MAGREQGELVDRLMARIGELESKLYQQELSDAQFTIPAIHGSPPSPRTAATAAATQLTASTNRQLLDSLGDPEKQAQTQAQQQTQTRDWRAAASSWLAANPLTRSALGSFSLSTAPATTPAAPLTGTAAAAQLPCDRLDSTARPSKAAAGFGSGSTFSTDSDSSLHSRCEDDSADRGPRASSGTALGSASSSGPSFSFQPRQCDHLADPLHASTPAAVTTAAAEQPSGSHAGTSSSDSSQPGRWGGLKSYYRYIMSPTQEDYEEGLSDGTVLRVQEAAGAALAEANERLLQAELRVQAAQAAQHQLQQQLNVAEQLQQDMEQLKTENLEAWQQKYELEKQLATCRATMQGMQGETSSMQKELEDLRQQAKIWCDAQHSQGDRLQAELELLNTQLAQRSSELSSIRQELTEARAERDRALQERQQATEERDRLQQQLQQVSSLQQQLSNAQQQVSAAAAAAAESAASAAEYQEKFIRERAVRRRLHEQLQVLRGNIRVLCRVRPAQQQQQQQSKAFGSNSSCCITVPMEGLLCVNDVASGRQREFEFDAVFGPEATQQQVFEEVSPLVRSCADGYNVCIFAYGQTGSGKTYTMEGPPDNPGLNSKALQELFRTAAEEGEEPSPWTFSVSMMEIYNEAVRDLLALAAAGGASSGGSSSSSPSSSASSSPSNSPPSAHAGLGGLDVSGLPAGELPPHMDRVPGLVWRDVSCAAEVSAVLKEGWRARATAATALNAASSRSHALLCVKIRGVREGRPFTSLLNLVDLAGSERVDKSEVTGQQLKEAQAINKSLSALGDVIAALQRRSPHIPFRNSKLTQVLQDSLCGSSKVLLVCNLSPEAVSCGETLSSLNFASRAAQVELGQARRAPTAAAAAPGSSNVSCSNSSSLDPGQPLGWEPSSSSSSLRCAGAAMSVPPGSNAAQRGSMRAKSPVAAGGPSPARVSGGVAAAAAVPGIKPASRLSERTSGSSTGLAGSGGSIGSPRVSMAKPARH